MTFCLGTGVRRYRDGVGIPTGTSFALLRSSIMSVRRARSSWHHPATKCPIDQKATLRWRASNVTQLCNNWRRGLRFTALERPSRNYRDPIHVVMPPVLFQGKSQWNNMLIFCMPQKSAKRLEQKRSLDTAPPLVTRGGYVVVWCRTNIPSEFLRYNHTKTIILTSR